MGKITKNYIINLIYQLFIMLVPLVTAPYLARQLGANALGQYSYVHSVTYMVTTVVMLGIYQYGNRQIAYVRENKIKITETFWQIMSTRLIIALVGTVIYALVVLCIGKYTTLFIIYYSYMLAYFLDCTWLFVGVEDMKWAVIKNTITKVIAIIGIFALVKEPDDIGIYVGIQGCSVLISNILAYSQISRYVGKPKLDLSHLKVDIKASALLFLPSLASTIYLQCDKVMIEMFTDSTAQVSFYDYAEKIVTIPLTFITVLSTVMMPRIANEFSKGNESTVSELINRAAKFSLFLAAPMTLGLMAVADKLVPWYLGEEYLPTIQAICLISPIVVSNSLSAISGNQYFVATNQINILLKSQVAACVGNIIINAILIPRYGFIGAAVATIICSYINAIIQYYYLVKQVKLTGLLLDGARYILFSVVMFLVIRVITGNFQATATTNILQILVGVIVYAILCLISRDKQFKMIIDKFLQMVRIKKE